MKIYAFFSNNKSAQDALNMITRSGLDIEEEHISVVMKDVEREEEDLLSTDMSTDKDEDDYSYANFDEDNATGDDVRGVFEPIGAVTIGGGRIDAQGSGDYIIAGPIAEDYESTEVDDPEDNAYELDRVLLDLGIKDEEIEAFENRIEAGQILFVVDAEDNVEEYQALIADAGGEEVSY